MLGQIRSLKNRALTAIGARFFSFPQNYDVTYEVTIQARNPEPQDIRIMIPCPASTSNQGVRDLAFHPDAECGQESLYGNGYASWKMRLNIVPIVLRQAYTCQVKPTRLKIDQRYVVDDYARLDAGMYASYLRPNRFIQLTDEVRRLSAKIVAGEKDVLLILKKINRYLIDHLHYGSPIEGLYSSSDALTNPMVDCGGYDSLYCSLAMAAGIPSRVVSGFWAGYSKCDMHAWAESLLPNGEWLPVDPSAEQLVCQGRSQKSGAFGFVGSDRILMSVGCDFPLEAQGRQVTCGILQHPVVVAEKGPSSISVSLSFTAKRR